MKQIVFVLVMFLLLNCKNNSDQHQGNSNKSKVDLNSLVPTVTLTPNRDTAEISFTVSDMLFKVNYYQNKPQYISIDRNYLGQVHVTNHFAKDHKGLFIALNDSGYIKTFGVKYYNGHNGIDISTDSAFSTFNNISVWSQYLNDGRKFDVSQLYQNRIKVYSYSAGDLVDSAIFIKK